MTTLDIYLKIFAGNSSRENFKGKLETIYSESGAWWGTDNIERKEEEIDIVLTSDSDILVAECKWQNEIVGDNILKMLIKRSALIQNGRNIHHVLFSETGFSEAIKDNRDVMCYTTKDLLEY